MDGSKMSKTAAALPIANVIRACEDVLADKMQKYKKHMSTPGALPYAYNPKLDRAHIIRALCQAAADGGESSVQISVDDFYLLEPWYKSSK
jgi:hypothetical protein